MTPTNSTQTSLVRPLNQTNHGQKRFPLRQSQSTSITAPTVTVASGTTSITLNLIATAILNEIPPQQLIEINEKPVAVAEPIEAEDEFTADIDCVDENNETPLTRAASSGDYRAVKMLLSLGCDTTHRNNYDRTALMMAAHRGHLETVKALLNHGVSVRMTNDRGHTALILALFEGHEEIVNLLSERLSPSELLLHKESLKLIMLGHATHQTGKHELASKEADAPASTVVSVEGGGVAYTLKKMRKATENIHKQANIFTKQEAAQLCDLINSGVNLSNRELLLRAEKGLPILLSSGYNKHAVSVLIWGQYFILCNRGCGSRSPIEVRTFNPKSLDEFVLNKIQTNKHYRDLAGYRALFFKELPRLLEFKAPGPFEQSLQFACSLKDQKVANCGWASPEAAIWSFLTLNSLLKSVHDEMDDLATLSDSEISACAWEGTEQFNSWLALTRMYRLKSYLGLSPSQKADSHKKAHRLRERRRHFEKNDAFVKDSMKVIQKQCASLTGPSANEVLIAFKNLEDEISLI